MLPQSLRLVPVPGSSPCIARSKVAPGGGGLVPAHIAHIQPLWDVLPTVPAGTGLTAR